MPKMTDLESLERARKFGAVRVMSNRYKDDAAAKAHERKYMAMNMGTLMAEQGFITFTEQPATYPPNSTEIRAAAVILPPETQANPAGPAMYATVYLRDGKPEFTDYNPSVFTSIEAAREDVAACCGTGSNAKVYRLVEVTEC